MYMSTCFFKSVNIGSYKYSFFGSAARIKHRVSFDSFVKQRSNPNYEEEGGREDTVQKHSRSVSHLNFGLSHQPSSGWHSAGTH